mgnify:CR=1 FL=1
MIYVVKVDKSNDVIVFDSITSFSESYAGSVSSHPVEDGTKMSDHAVSENTKIRINGVVTDYNFFNPLKDFANSTVPVYEYQRSTSMLSINSEGNIETASSTPPKDYLTSGGDSIKASEDVVKNKLKEIKSKNLFVTILAYDFKRNNNIIESFPNCILTDLSFERNEESGYAIYPNMTFEQVVVTSVKTITATADKSKLTGASTGLADANSDKGSVTPDAKATDNNGNPKKNKGEIYGFQMTENQLQTAIKGCLDLTEQAQEKALSTGGKFEYPACFFEFKKKGIDILL